MKTITHVLALLLFCAGQPLFSQNFEVPKNYHFQEKEDYTPYEKDIIAASKWLESNALDIHDKKWKEVGEFVVKWVNGSPAVNVMIGQTVINFDKKTRA